MLTWRGCGQSFASRSRRILVAVVSAGLVLASVVSAPSAWAVVVSPAPDAQYPVGTQPQGVAVNPGGTVAIVANYGSNTASRIDLTNGNVTSVPVGLQPWDVAIDPSGTYAYVTNSGASTVTRIKLNDSSTTTITVGSGPTGIVIDPAGTYAYVTVGGNADRIKLSDITVSTSFLAGITGPLVIAADGFTIYSYSGTGRKYSAATGAQIGSSFNTGAGSVTGAGFNADQSAVFGVNQDGWFRRTDTSLLTSIAYSGAGYLANSWLSIGNTAFVAARGDHNLYKIDLTTGGTSAVASGISEAYDVAAPSDGSFVLVTSYGTNTVVRFNGPGAPSAPTATRGSAQATVTASGAGTGATPTSLVVTSSPGGFTCTIYGSSGSCDVTGLTNGTSYTFSVRAANAFGTSAGSGASNSVTPGAPAPTFTATNPTFPDTTIGSTSTGQTVTVTNTGNASLTFAAGAITMTGAQAADYAMSADTCSSTSVAASATCTVTVTFTPSAAGTRTAALAFASNAASSPDTVTLTGLGSAQGGGGGSVAPTPIPSAAATSSPSTTQPVVPSEELRPGATVVTVDGQPEAVIVRANATKDALDVDGAGWGVQLAAHDSGSRTAPLGPDGTLQLTPGRTLGVTGNGYRPGSEVSVYLKSTPILLGTLVTDARGDFAGLVPLPADLTPGEHTTQVIGYAINEQLRSVSIGVSVVTPSTAHRLGARVLFEYQSTSLSSSAKRALTSLAQRVRGAVAAATIVIGVVRAKGSTAADKALATQRAQAVAAYLRKAGLPGTTKVSTRALPVTDAPEARRVVVTVRYSA